MYLKTLELHGFKSFPNRTVLHFEKGTTVVVGPNGSGKSNISDAMRWVLGELSSRNIRGTKMEDVIFGGTDDRRPMGFAEVSVTFDNTDKENALNLPYDEVVVTRRYYRAGESEYMINRKPCRLRDIYELFLNTGVGREGYSIIGQGRIAEILSKKSEDRRNFFEEAAGISKFRVKKHEAERKLADTENNMVRVRDILGELEGRVGPLKRDAEKARRYLELYEIKKAADVSLWLYDTERLRHDIQAAKDACSLSENELMLVTESLASLERQSDRLDEELRNGRLLSERLMHQIQDLNREISECSREYDLLENEARHRAQLIEDCNARIDEANRTAVTLAAECEENRGKVMALREIEADLDGDQLAALAAQQEKLLAAQRLEELLADKLKEKNDLDARAVDIRVRIDVLKNTKETDTDKTASLEAEIAAYEKEGEALAAEAARCEKNAAGFRTQIDAFDKTITEGTEEKDTLSATRAEWQDELNRCEVERNTAVQRAEALARMEEHFEGYQNSVRFLMQRYTQSGVAGAGKIYGPLSQLITTENEYVLAIETALGASLQNIVVDNDVTARAAIACLRDNRAGRATFYPVSSIRPQGETDEVRRAASLRGYIGRADKLVSCDGRFAGIVEWLLGRSVIFDNLDNAADAAKSLRYRVKLVTLDGQVINAGGSFTGGSAKHDSGMLSRTSQIEKLHSEAAALDKRIAVLKKEIAEADDRIARAHNAVRDAEQQKELLLTMSRAQFAALDTANAKWEANKELTAKLRLDLDAIAMTGVRAEEECARLAVELDALDAQIEAISNERAAIEVEKNALLDEKDRLGEEISALRVRIAETRGEIQTAEQLIRNAEERIDALGSGKTDQQERISDHESWLLDQKNRLSANRRHHEELSTRLSEVEENRRGVEAENDELDRRLSELKLQTRNKQGHKDLCYETNTRNHNKLERLTAEYDRVGSSLFDDYELTAEEARALNYPPVTKENHAEIAATRTECRQKIKALGSVNVAAIEEYDQVKERYETLAAQVDDLNRSYEDLMGIVQQIEAEMKTGFVAAFTEINKNFGVVFRELFGGGQAELSLTDPEDVLNCGIEIKAAPPGKIIKNLSLLSGGEQAFVACALFFAILKVNPTPFCLLDEIEAALDEVNVYRLGEYIRKFCHETQFILITHRRGTMQIADRLYGVTMPERGVSKIIALDLDEVESKSKEFTDGLL